MHSSQIFCRVFYITGAVIFGVKGNEQVHRTQASTEPSSDDFYPNYSDYPNVDYPNLDYYDDGRGARSSHDHHPSSNDNTDYQENVDEEEDFMIKQLKSTIPGTPGVDYALYQSLPDTSFRCDSQRNPGFYGDVEFQCQVFHICQDNDRQDSFLCPIGTVFNQMSFICDWWFNFNCEDTPTYYQLNGKFHSPTGSTSMMDTMRRMKNFQENKDMRMIMGMAKVHKNLHRMQNMNNRASVKRSMSPKVRNLFMLRMRNKRLGRKRNAVVSEHDVVIPDNTSFADGTPLMLKATSSAGYLDSVLSEYTTTTSNISSDDLNNKPPTPVTTIANERFDATEIISNSTSSLPQSLLRSLLNTSNIEMVMNGSIVTTMKLDHIDLERVEASTSGEHLNVTTDAELGTVSELNTPEHNKEKTIEVNSHLKSNSDSEHETEHPFKITTVLLQNKSSTREEINTEPSSGGNTEPTIFPHNGPSDEENNFSIGNGTHISVSVTILSKSGHSKLLWKRLPGIKRIRKVRLRNADENTSFPKDSANETIYRRRNDELRPKTRIMWIPAMKNTLDRRLDWKALLESKPHGNMVAINLRRHFQPLNELDKEAVESSEIPSIHVMELPFDVEENGTHQERSKFPVNLEVTLRSAEESPTTATAEYSKTDDHSFKKTHENTTLSQKLESLFDSDANDNNRTEIKANKNEGEIEEISKNCKTICIKLLRSLHTNSLNSTGFEKRPSALTLFDYESNDSRNKNDYGRKGVLGLSPSEQWTVKYDPGPNCNENSDDSQVLVKGWSVIIDTGFVTKEKTVKKRSCPGSSSDGRFVLMENIFPAQNSGKGGIKFNGDISNIPLNSKSGSTDQRYWLNLVKNWLELSSSNRNHGNKKVKTMPPQNLYLNEEQMFDKAPNSGRARYGVPQELNSAKSHILSKQQMKNSNDFQRRHKGIFENNSNKNINFEARDENYEKDFMDDTMFFEGSRRQKEFNILSSGSDNFSDLQTERSDRFQATQKKNWSNNKRDSSKDYARNYWQSEIRDSRRDYDFENDRATSETDYFENQAYDYPRRENPRVTADLSANKWQQNKDSEFSRGRNKGDPKTGMDRTQNNNQRSHNRNKSKGTKSDVRTKSWSSGSRTQHKGSRRADSTPSWKLDSKIRNNKGKPSGWSSNPMTDINRAHNGKGNWHPEKGYDGNIQSTSKSGRNDWSSSRLPNIMWSTDKKNQRKDSNWTSNRQKDTLDTSSRPKDSNLQISKNEKKNPWFSDEEQNRRRDSDSDWFFQRMKKDEDWEDWNKPEARNKGRTSRSRTDWNSEEGDWGYSEEIDAEPPDSQNKAKQFWMPSDWSSETDDFSNWSSSSRGGRNKGFVVHNKESPDWSSENNRDWTPDAKTETWPSSGPVSRSKNTKGSAFDSHGVSTSGNSNNRNYDQETWMTDFMRNPSFQKGIKAESDWVSESDIQGSHAPQNKGTWDGNRSLNQPNIWNKGNTASKGDSIASWDSKSPTDSKSNVHGHNSQKPQSNSKRNTWGSSKSNKKPSSIPQSSSKGNAQNRSKMSWKNADNSRNSTNSKGDSEIKKIVWSAQISSDGKLGNGWVPITLRPTIKNKQNGTQKGWIHKGSTSNDDDWKKKMNPSNDRPWNSKGSSTRDTGWKKQDSSKDRDWNSKGSASRNDDWKNQNPSKDKDWSSKGSSPRDEDWRNQESSKDSDWNSKGSSSRDKDWKNQDSSRDNDWNSKGRSSRDEDWKNQDFSKDRDWNSKGSSSRDEDWKNQDASKDRDWNSKGSSSRDEDWKNQDSSKENGWNSKGSSSRDKNWKNQDSSRDRDWSSKGSSSRDEDWKNQESSKDRDWNSKGSASRNDNRKNQDSSRDRDWNSKGSFSRDEDWKNQDSSRDRDWNSKGSSSRDRDWSSKGSSSRDEDWKNQESSKDRDWNSKGSSRDKNWENQDSSKDRDWSNKGSSSRDEDWNSKGSPSRDKEWANQDSSKDRDWSNKGSSSRAEDWKNQDSSIDRDMKSKGSSSRDSDWTNRGSSSKDENWHNKGIEWLSKNMAYIKDRDNERSGRGIDTQSPQSEDWNDKSSSSIKEDGDEKELKIMGNSFNQDFINKDVNDNLEAQISQYSQTITEEKGDITTETNTKTTQMPEASFSHLFYIPRYNFRNKREYANSGRRLKTRDTTNRSYKIIKSGEILDDISEDNNKFFLAKADLVVQGHQTFPNNKNEDSIKHLDHIAEDMTRQNFESGIKNFEMNVSKTFNTHKLNWDITPKESILRERWSSPLLSSNFSASGWIPVTEFKPTSNKNFTEYPSKSIKKLKDFIIKTDDTSLDVNQDTKDSDYLIVKNISDDPAQHSESKIFNVLFRQEEEGGRKAEDETDIEKSAKNSENGTEMKVGNTTLRILSFSDIMKQLQNEDNSLQKSHESPTNHGISWNVPLTIDPKTYSLKLIDAAKETVKNFSNSWVFSLNENETKQAWVLVRNNNTRPSNPRRINASELNKQNKDEVDSYKIIVGNRTTSSEVDHKHVNSTVRSLLQSRTNSDKSRKFTNWSGNSDWTPIIRTVGRVIMYNRTLLMDKE